MKNIFFTTVVLAATALVGCKVDVPQNRPAADLSGVAADNIVRNGDVRVYAWNGSEREILLTTKTDNYGYYVDPLQAESQFIKICVVSGEYTEEASSINIRLEDGDRMCAVTYWESGQAQETMVTPETNMAAALMEYEVKAGKGNIQNIVSSANAKIGALFGYDILTTKPADMTSDDLAYTGLNDSVRSGLWHAAFSRIALEAAKANGLSTHTSLISSMALHKAIYRDLSADGKLDGWGVAENGKTKVRLGLGSFELNANVYRTELAKELVNFVKSDRNKTAVKTNDVLSYATTLSLTTDSIFSDKDIPVAFDDKAPTIALDTPENTYISGTYTLGVKVTDFSGVKAVSYTLNDGNPQDFDFTQENLVIDTKQFNNGDFEIAITAIDKLDNEGTLKRNFRIVNEQPVANIISPTLVNYTTGYNFEAELGEVKAGVGGITVDGKVADYADGKVTASNVRLSQGQNTLSMVVTDATGAEYSYSWVVDVDTRKPDLAWKGADWKVLVKLNNGSIEPQTISETMRENILITPLFYRLDTLAVIDSALSSAKWPTLRFSVKDTATTTNTYSTKTENLDIQLQYRKSGGSPIYFSRQITANDDGVLIIPLSEEFLGDKWYEKTEGNELVIHATDEAGNTSTKSWRVPFVVSAPKLDLGLSIENTYLNGSPQINLNGVDLIGAEYISFSINGGTPYKTTDMTSTFFEFDTNNLDDGQHRLVTKIVTGEQVVAQEYEFNVDNTPPTLVIDEKISPNLVSSASYTLKATAGDIGSGLDSGFYQLNSERKVTLSLLNNGLINATNLTLSPEENEFLLSVTDVAGNLTEKIHKVFYDGIPPLFNPFLEEGKITEQNNIELYKTDFQVRYGVTHANQTNSLNDVIGSGALTGQHIYLDEKTNNVQNLKIGDTGIGSNANLINNDLSLNVNHYQAVDYLKTNNIAHFNFHVSDSKFKDGTVADLNGVKTKLKVEFNGVIKSDKEISHVTTPLPNGQKEYIVPITKEFFGDELLTAGVDDVVTATFTVIDEAGNETVKSYKFNVFNVPTGTAKPVITGFSKPAAYLKSHTTPAATVKSSYGLSTVSYKVDGAEKSTFNNKSKVVKDYPLPVVSCKENSVCTVEVKAVDLAGNTFTDSYATTTDNIPPVLSITAPPANVIDPFNFTWSVSDKNLESVKVYNGGSLIHSGSKSGSLNITPTGTDGVRKFRVVVEDKAKNITEKTVNVNFQHNVKIYSVEASLKQRKGMSGTDKWAEAKLVFSHEMRLISATPKPSHSGYTCPIEHLKWSSSDSKTFHFMGENMSTACPFSEAIFESKTTGYRIKVTPSW